MNRAPVDEILRLRHSLSLATAPSSQICGVFEVSVQRLRVYRRPRVSQGMVAGLVHTDEQLSRWQPHSDHLRRVPRERTGAPAFSGAHGA